MALPILDGNQSATTLSTIFTAGAHIPAHTVVSLGTQAITDISSAVSGISVSVEGTQSVTGSVSVLNFPSTQTIAGTVTVSNATAASAVFVKICGEMDGAGTNEPREILTDNSGMLYVRLAPNNAKTADPVIYDPVAGTAYINVRQQAGTSITVGNSVTIGSLPAISGTVTANLSESIIEPVDSTNATQVIAVHIKDADGNTWGAENIFPVVASGTVTVGNSVTIGSLPAISGTVTVAAMPSGALTTRFGSVTTANTAQITSAVTNTSRKYLLAQNISAGTVTIGIGFSPTTTQGIQLAAGAGLTFDAFCPTGAIYWLGAVTGAALTILEG